MLPDLFYAGSKVRVFHTPDGIAFAAVDVCGLLGIKNHRHAVHDFNANQKGVVLTDTLGGRQKIVVVYKPGLYQLVLKSGKPEARKFQDWVTDEVLPCIEKYGTYPAPVIHQVTMRPFLHRTQFCLGSPRSCPRGTGASSRTRLLCSSRSRSSWAPRTSRRTSTTCSTGRWGSTGRCSGTGSRGRRSPHVSPQREAPLSASNSVTGQARTGRAPSQDAAIVVASTLPLTSAGVSEPSRSA